MEQLTNLSLTQDEAYILSLIMGSVRYCDNEAVNTLLEKTTSLFEVSCEEYEKVVVYVNDNGGIDAGKVDKESFVVISFEGSNLSDDLFIESLEKIADDVRAGCKGVSKEGMPATLQTFDPLADLYQAFS